jgi:hypothetical protein
MEALEQHKQDSPIHQELFHCVTCNCYFGSEKALKNHRRGCMVNRVFSRPSLDPLLGLRRDKAVVVTNVRAGRQTLDMPSLIIKRYTRVLASVNPATVTALLKILRETTAQPTQETREFFMFPALHQNVANAVSPEISSTWFQEGDDDDACNDEYLTHVMGIFICNNSACKTPIWVSWKVPIEIKGYDGNGYSAVVYSERCKCCGQLGTFVLDEESYIDRVAYRIKKWAGVVMALPYYKSSDGPPHERDFCEGCKRGKCQAGYRSAFYYGF